MNVIDMPAITRAPTPAPRRHAVTAGGGRRCAALLGVVLVLAALATPALALDPRKAPSQFRWDRWSGDDLPTRSLRTVVVGSDGYIWLPSYAGLLRFDGVRFEVFLPPEAIGVTTNGFTTAAPGTDGALWLGGVGGGIYRFADGRFSCVLQTADSRLNTVGPILEDGRGTVWIGGTRGLGRLLHHGGGWSCDWVEELAELDVTGLALDANGRVWVATSHGLWAMDEAGVATPHPVLDRAAVSSMTLGPDGRLWLWTADRGLTAVDTTPGAAVEYVPAAGLQDVSALHFDRDGALWLATNDSVHRMVDGVVERWPGPTDGGVTSFAEDREGNLWFTSFYQGLVRLADGKFRVFSLDEGLSNEIVHALAEGWDGSIWVGTTKGLNHIVGDRVVAIPKPLRRFASRVIFSLASGPGGELWIGVFDDGLYRWDGRKLTHFGTDDGLANLRLRRLYHDGDRLWIGSFKGLYSLRDGRMQAYTRADGLLNDFVLSIHRVRDGRLWVGTDGGGLATLEDGRFHAFTTDDGLPSMFVTDIHEDAAGTLWLTTAAGLCRYRDGRFTTLTAAGGLVGRAFFQILEDDEGYLWMTGPEGISRVRKADVEAVMDGGPGPVTAILFDRADGLEAVTMSGVAKALKASDGRLWFSTMRGAAVVDPADIVFNPVPPPVYIEAVTGDGRPLPMIDGRVEVPVGARSLEIRYTGLSFVAPAKVRFKYRLAGFSDEWQDAGARRTAYFTGLAPGRYGFQVTACNNDGLWSDHPAAVSFAIAPRFRQTPLFYALCGFGIFLLGLGAAMVRVRALKRRERVLADLVDERTRELAEANEELARMARVDAQTGIANYRRFEEFFADEWRRLARVRQPLSVIMIDVDHFKQFNDQYGHQEGDACLRAIARIAHRVARRPGDLAARYGGEEFILVLGNTPHDAALAAAESVRSGVVDAAIPYPESDHGVLSVSCGVATVVPGESLEPADLIRRADAALYRAKDAGRNRVEA